MKKKTIPIILLAAVLLTLTPGWLWLAWWLHPHRTLTVAIIDKTAADPNQQEHLSLDWVLNQQRFTKTAASPYQPNRDYFGFFARSDHRYQLKGLERFRPEDLDRLATDADLIYFADTYGVDGIYGGMSQQDIQALRAMKARHKTAIAEFNSIGSPTPDTIRHQFEDLYGLRWTGWTARYFPTLDTLQNADLPRWLTNSYRTAHGGAWPFHKAGIAWVNTNGKVVVTETGITLNTAIPRIETTAIGQQPNLPRVIDCPFWFDVIDPPSTTPANETLAEFIIPVNDSGARLLTANGIPARCPAILRHLATDYGFYYFSGDFCNNPISYTSSYFEGVAFFENMFRSKPLPGDRKPFFWDFYRPLLTNILEAEYRRTKSYRP